MPLISAAVSPLVVAVALWVSSATIAVLQPASPDIYAVLGAGPGAILAILGAIKRGSARADTARVFIGSCAVGMFGPGVLWWTLRYWWKWLPDEAAANITWHFWAAAGLLGALMGWGFLHKVNVALARASNKFLHLPNDEEETKVPDAAHDP